MTTEDAPGQCRALPVVPDIEKGVQLATLISHGSVLLTEN